jgi:hypothetical protein
MSYIRAVLRCLPLWRPFWFAENRIAKLEAKCSPSAREFLRQLRMHPSFADLVAKLESIESTVFRGDIEEALEALNGKSRFDDSKLG